MSDQQRMEKAIIAAGLVDRWMADSKYDFDTVTRLLEDPETPPEHRERLRKKLRAFRIVVDRLHEVLYSPDMQIQLVAAAAEAEVKQPAEPPKLEPSAGSGI